MPARPVVPKWKRTRHERCSVALLRLAPNARAHPKWQIEKFRASLRRFGFCQPLLIDPSGLVICGGGRLIALRAEGYLTAPVIVVPPSWTARDCAAYAHLDNELALTGGLGELVIVDTEIDTLLPSIGDHIGTSEFPLVINFSNQLDRDEAIERIKNDGIAG
jgi:hypothetical protein